ncbi:MAG TPA: DUF4394 domain-containing protein [Oligoflexia bacterium]|nr:DUF4394 domain-containing protein [Oligoflexia bacterium]HMP27373.1 DUF4394 domain-containing protein [Oligoflexia bacterium]
MNKPSKILTSCGSLMAILCSSIANIQAVTAEPIIALNRNENTLTMFDSNAPATSMGSLPISGLQQAEIIMAIDFRPSNNKLYGLGSSSRIYQIDLTNGLASPIGASAFNPPLSGGHFGFDFDPTTDRVRIISDTGKNFTVSADTGSVITIENDLSFYGGDQNTPKPNIVAIAHTNNFLGAISSVVYALDSRFNILGTIGSKNGSIAPSSGLVFNEGALGVDFTEIAGFDISPTSGEAYAVLTKNGFTYSEFYRINFSTGSLQKIGVLPGDMQARSIAIPYATMSAPSLSLEKTSYTTTKNSITIRGTASDNFGLSAVVYRYINKRKVKSKSGKRKSKVFTSDWMPTQGTNIWEAYVGGLPLGTTRIEIQVYNLTGQSVSAEVAVKRKAPKKRSKTKRKK